MKTQKLFKLENYPGYTKLEVKRKLVEKGFIPRYSGKDKGFYVDSCK